MSTDQAAIDRLAAAALGCYDLDPAASVRLINVSENWTYRVEEPGGRRASRCACTGPATTRPREIESELDWIDALREDGVVETAHAVAGAGGGRVCQVRTDDLGERNVVLFEWLAGDMPDADAHDLLPGFRTPGGGLGAHARRTRARWTPPAGVRPLPLGLLDTRSARSGHWGRWQDGLGHGRRGARAAGAARRHVRRAARASTARGRDRFGLVHADIRLANLLVDGDARARDRLRRLRLRRGSCTTSRPPSRSSRTTRDVPELHAGLGRGLPVGGAARPRRRGRARRRS